MKEKWQEKIARHIPKAWYGSVSKIYFTFFPYYVSCVNAICMDNLAYEKMLLKRIVYSLPTSSYIIVVEDMDCRDKKSSLSKILSKKYNTVGVAMKEINNYNKTFLANKNIFVVISPEISRIKAEGIILEKGGVKERIISVPDYSMFHEKKLDYYDILLGYTYKEKDIVGFQKIYESKKENALKIIVLGNSTTDQTDTQVNPWTYYLSNFLLSNSVNADILCGAVKGMSASQELIKLIRDVMPMKPDIVITYSGVNDIPISDRHMHPYDKPCKNAPFIRNYQIEPIEICIKKGALKNRIMGNIPIMHATVGVPNHECAEVNWINAIKMMNAVCATFNVKFVCFLQPNEFLERGKYKYKLSKDKRAHLEDYINSVNEWYENVFKQIKGIEYIEDLTPIFANQCNIYIDSCHLYEKGNEILGRTIGKWLVDNMISEE